MDLKNYIPTKENLVVELVYAETKVKNDAGEEVSVSHKMLNEDGSVMTITIMSPHSKEAREVLYKASKARSNLFVEKQEKEILPSDLEDLYIDNLVETTVDWNITWDGVKPTFSKDLAKQLYQDAFWIRSVIEEAKVKTLDFMKA